MKPLISSAALLLAVLFPSAASAVSLTATTTSITISDPITFKITTAVSSQLISFVIKDAFQTAPSSIVWMGVDFVGGLPVSVNGNVAGSIWNGFYGSANNDFNIEDLKMDATPQYSLSIGDIVTLGAGTYTFAQSTILPSGDYTMYISNPQDFRISENGVQAVPEPSTWVFLGAGAAGLAISLRRKQLAKAA